MWEIVHLVGFHYNNLVDNLPLFLSFVPSYSDLFIFSLHILDVGGYCYTWSPSDTHARGWTPLDEWSARRINVFLYNSQLTQESDTRALSGIRIRNPSQRAAAILQTARPPTSAWNICVDYRRSVWWKVCWPLCLEWLLTAVDGKVWTIDVVCGGRCADRCAWNGYWQQWTERLVSVAMRLERRLCGHKACFGLHVKCASCLSDCSHSRTVSADISWIPQCRCHAGTCDGCRVVASGRTDRHDGANCHFPRLLFECAQMCICTQNVGLFVWFVCLVIRTYTDGSCLSLSLMLFMDPCIVI